VASLREWEIGVVVSQGNRSYRSYIFLLIRGRKKPVDAHLSVPYDPWQHWKGGDSKIYEF
jgi:hypothetical protein